MTSLKTGDTFTIDIAPRIGPIHRLAIRLGLATPPAIVRREFTVTHSQPQALACNTMTNTTP